LPAFPLTIKTVPESLWFEVADSLGSRAQRPEPEAPPPEQRHEPVGCVHSRLPIGTRILVMPIVHHDDVAVRGALG
jgi:hypothetical protein